MNTATLIACTCLISSTALVSAQDHASSSHTQHTAEPVNAMCPIGKEPIVPSAGTVVYKGKTVGLCCPGCGKQFLAWDETRKDEFIALALAGREPGMEHPDHADRATPNATDRLPSWTEPYSLGVCPISGEKLGSMGDALVKTYDGREIRFCCGGCVDEFEADLSASWKKVDEAIVKDQLRYYPLETCVVSGEPLIEDGKDVAINMVYGNRLVRLCCTMCEREFRADPRKFIAMLDRAAADAQRKDYPLTTCVVAGGELGSMGEPAELVIAGRLIRLCCAGCEPKVKADPATYIAEIDKAWQAKGKFMPQEAHGHDEHGEHGAEGGHGDHDHGG